MAFHCPYGSDFNGNATLVRVKLLSSLSGAPALSIFQLSGFTQILGIEIYDADESSVLRVEEAVLIVNWWGLLARQEEHDRIADLGDLDIEVILSGALPELRIDRLALQASGGIEVVLSGLLNSEDSAFLGSTGIEYAIAIELDDDNLTAEDRPGLSGYLGFTHRVTGNHS